MDKDKIELNVYLAGNGLHWKLENNKCILTSPLIFIPLKTDYTEEEAELIEKVLAQGNPSLKLTIEKAWEEI